MRFEGEFRVPGAPEQVLAAFADVERMVKCMPGASIDGRDAEGNYLGAMLVTFGPKKIRFKGKVQCAVDAAAQRGTLDVRGAAQMRMAAPAQVHVQYTVSADPAGTKPTSVVALVSEAELGGVLADFARTGGVAVTRALMDVFAERLAEEFSREAPAEPAVDSASTAAAAPQASSPQAPAAAEALSAGHVLWLVVKARLALLANRMKSRLRRTS